MNGLSDWEHLEEPMTRVLVLRGSYVMGTKSYRNIQVLLAGDDREKLISTAHMVERALDWAKDRVYLDRDSEGISQERVRAMVGRVRKIDGAEFALGKVELDFDLAEKLLGEMEEKS